MIRRCAALLGGMLLILTAEAVSAQAAPTNEPKPAPQPTLQDRLRPAPVPEQVAPRLTEEERAQLRKEMKGNEPTAAPSGRATAYMLAGGALFVAGVIAGGGVGGLLMLGGAVIGAYGIYLHFR